MDPGPVLPPLRIDRNLNEITGRDHRGENDRETDARHPIAAPILELADDVSAPDETNCKYEYRRSEYVQMLEMWLPRVIDDRPLVGRLREIPHPAIHEARRHHREIGPVQNEFLTAVHRSAPPSAPWWIASTLRTASGVARAVRVAPVTGRMPLVSWRSSSNCSPSNCRYHTSRGT